MYKHMYNNLRGTDLKYKFQKYKYKLAGTLAPQVQSRHKLLIAIKHIYLKDFSTKYLNISIINSSLNYIHMRQEHCSTTQTPFFQLTFSCIRNASLLAPLGPQSVQVEVCPGTEILLIIFFTLRVSLPPLPFPFFLLPTFYLTFSLRSVILLLILSPFLLQLSQAFEVRGVKEDILIIILQV